MTIEATLERIAIALETIASGGGLQSAAPTKTTRKRTTKKAEAKAEEPTETKKEEAPAPDDQKAEAEAEGSDGPTLDDVRAALKALQAATDPKKTREVLSTAGGNGALSKVKPAKYQAVIDKCQEIVAEAGDGDE